MAMNTLSMDTLRTGCHCASGFFMYAAVINSTIVLFQAVLIIFRRIIMG